MRGSTSTVAGRLAEEERAAGSPPSQQLAPSTVEVRAPAGKPSGIYAIGRLCRDFGVTPRTLRYYEELGLLAPDRENGQRRYSAKDRAHLSLILQGRAVGVRLNEIGGLLDLHEREDSTCQHLSTLSALRRRLEVLEVRREACDQVIALLRGAVERASGLGDLEDGCACEGLLEPHLKPVRVRRRLTA